MPYSIRTDDNIVIDNIPDDVKPDADELKQRVAEARASRDGVVDEQGPSVKQIAGGMGAEIGVGVSSQAAGAALAPFTAGVSYPVLAFAGGVAGSIAAQKIEGAEDISVGRALFAGIANLIPGSSVAKGAVKAGVKVNAAKVLAKKVAKDSLRGGVIGAAEATSIAAIDKQRPPTYEELLTYGGAGTFAGGAFSFIGESGSKLWKRIKGKTPDDVDAMVARGEITPKELESIPALKEAALNLQNKVEEAPVVEFVMKKPSSIVTASVAPSKVLGEEIKDVALRAKSEIRAIDERGSILAKRIDKVISKQKNPEAAKVAVDKYLDGTADSLPESLNEIKVDLDIGRETIKEQQLLLLDNIDMGRSPQAEGVAEEIAKSVSEGDYLTREYEFFTNNKYRPTQKQRDAVIDEISGQDMARAAKEGSTVSAEEARAKAIAYINELQSKKPSDVGRTIQFPTAIDGVLRRKKDVGPALRDYLGEITSPGERVRGTLSRTARVVQRDTSDAKIKELLVKGGLGTTEPMEGLVEATLKRGGEPSGVYVDRATQKALDILYVGDGARATSDVVANTVKDLWQSSISLSKASKVLMNPPAYAVQVYGNAANLMGMGMNPLAGSGKAMRLALSEFGPIQNIHKSPESRRALLDDMREMTRYGIKGANIMESDIRSGLEGGKLGEWIMKPLDPLGKLYSVPDTAGRYVAWKHNQRAMQSIFPNATPDSIKQLSANITNDTYQNYERLSKTVKGAARVGLIPQFASFTMEFARNQYNQGRIINKMLKGELGDTVEGLGVVNKQAMMDEGKRRLASLTALYGLTLGGIAAFNHENGNTAEVDAALKESVLPEWDENKLLMASYDKETQSGKYANPSYVIPHTVGMSALQQGLQGKPISGVGNMLAEEFVGEGSFVARSLYDAISGRDSSTGKRISAETDLAKETIDRAAFFFRDAFSPGFMREKEKYDKASRGQGNLSKTDVIARQAGYRVNSFDVKEQARFKIGRSVANANLAKSRYSAARDYEDMSPEQLEDAYKNNNSAFIDAQNKNISHAKNLSALGLTDNERIQVLRDSGMGAIDVLGAINGTVRDIPKVDRITPTSVWSDQVFPLSDKDRVTFIRNLSKTDRKMAAQLTAKDKADRIDRHRNVSPMDSLIRTLGVSDGARANYILNESKKYEDPKAYINLMRRKGVVTKEVSRQIDNMKNAALLTPNAPQ